MILFLTIILCSFTGNKLNCGTNFSHSCTSDIPDQGKISICMMFDSITLDRDKMGVNKSISYNINRTQPQQRLVIEPCYAKQGSMKL